MINTTIILKSKSKPGRHVTRPSIPPNAPYKKESPIKKAILLLLGVILLLTGLCTWVLLAPSSYSQWAAGSYRLVHWITVASMTVAGLIIWSTLRFQKRMYLLTLLYLFFTGFFYLKMAGDSVNWGHDLISYKMPPVPFLSGAGDAVWSFMQRNASFLDLDQFVRDLKAFDWLSWYVRVFGMLIPAVFIGYMINRSHKLRLYFSPPGVVFCFLLPDLVFIFSKNISIALVPWVDKAGLNLFEQDTLSIRNCLWSLGLIASAVSIRMAWSLFATEDKGFRSKV
ncbi:MAG: hypothetical protein EOL87_04850 [Spartobacteria bacterium]|nr:hypothetical protein [Spartobacteria bacterium]